MVLTVKGVKPHPSLTHSLRAEALEPKEDMGGKDSFKEHHHQCVESHTREQWVPASSFPKTEANRS